VRPAPSTAALGVLGAAAAGAMAILAVANGSATAPLPGGAGPHFATAIEGNREKSGSAESDCRSAPAAFVEEGAELGTTRGPRRPWPIHDSVSLPARASKEGATSPLYCGSNGIMRGDREWRTGNNQRNGCRSKRDGRIAPRPLRRAPSLVRGIKDPVATFSEPVAACASPVAVSLSLPRPVRLLNRRLQRFWRAVKRRGIGCGKRNRKSKGQRRWLQKRIEHACDVNSPAKHDGCSDTRIYSTEEVPMGAVKRTFIAKALRGFGSPR
jgi:hypothetical protein